MKSDGTIWMWGWNNLGQLGNGTATDTNVPVQVLNLTNMIFAGVTGDRNNCAIKADHSVWIWGRDFNGQLGNGMTDSIAHPFSFEDDTSFGNATVVAVQTPDWHSLALEADGTLWGWGSNDHGQLGNGTTNDEWTPGVVLWPVVAPPPPFTLAGKKLGDGVWQGSFTNNPGMLFAVLMTSNLSISTSRLDDARDGCGNFFGVSSSSLIRRRLIIRAGFYRIRTP